MKLHPSMACKIIFPTFLASSPASVFFFSLLASLFFSVALFPQPSFAEPNTEATVEATAKSPAKSKSKTKPPVHKSSIENDATPESDSLVRDHRTIPYPNGALYLSRGIAGSFAGGTNSNPGEDQNLYQWQGELGYYYKPWFSGGLGFRIIAGEPSDSKQRITNRYFLLTRFHLAWSRLALYAGPQIGVDNLNVLVKKSNSDSLKTVNPLETNNDPFTSTNASVGLELGAGSKPLGLIVRSLGLTAPSWSDALGLTFGNRLEYSLVGERNYGSDQSFNVRLLFGTSLDLLTFLPSLRPSVRGLWWFVEYQRSYLILQKVSLRDETALISGVSLAF